MKKSSRFPIIFSVLTVIGLICYLEFPDIPEPILSFIYCVTGFHIPQNTLYFATGFVLFTDYPLISLVFILILITFVVFWVISLVRLQSSNLFYYLIIFDRALSLLMLVAVVIILWNEFSGWYWFIVPVVENAIIIMLCIQKRAKQEYTMLCSVELINSRFSKIVKTARSFFKRN